MIAAIRQRAITWGSPIIALAILYAAWELLVRIGDIKPLLLPTPSKILVQAWTTRGTLTEFVLFTAKEATVGLAAATIATLVVGVLIFNSRALSSLGTALAGAGRALPTIVLFPVVTIFLGTTSTGVEVITAITVAPLMFGYILTGLTQETDLDDLLHVAGGSGWQRFTMVRAPVAVPYVVTGLRTALPLSIISAIVAEYFGGSTSTLGAYIRLQSGQLHTLELWAAIAFACLLGVAAFAVGAVLERAMARWTHQAHAFM